MGGTDHLIRRFFGSLRRGGPSPADCSWVGDQLNEAECGLWEQMSGPDRRHSVAVAREVDHRLGRGSTMPVRAAALLHDVGKIDADLGTGGRVVATLAAKVLGRDSAQRWRQAKGFRGKIGRYLHHPEIGAEMLERAGSDPLTVAWAAEHHRPTAEWTLDPATAAVLHEVDND